DSMLHRVRRALGRGQQSSTSPPPPEIPEHLVRLVHTELGLPELFAKRAAEAGMQVSFASPEEIASQLIGNLRENGVRRVGMASSKLLDQLGIIDELRNAEFERVARWDQIVLDEMYDFDCGVTDASFAIAETGSIVIRTHAGNGRALSLAPLVHAVVLEPKNF